MEIDLNTSMYDVGLKIANSRTNQKENYKSSRPFSKNYELVGVLGEIVYGLTTNEYFDSVLRVNGDEGFDFSKKVQVKSSEKFKAKHLIEYMDKDFSKFNYYVFVVVDLENKSGEVIGWISTNEFLELAQKENFGYGDRLAIPLTRLHKFKDNGNEIH